MRWGRRAKNLITVNPASVAWFGPANYSGETVTEETALTYSAIWRGALLISGTAGTLPLKTYTTDSKTDERTRVKSFLDDPGTQTDGSPTYFEWVETNLLHLVLHGEAPLLHRYNAGGALVGLEPVHPMSLGIERAPRPLSGPGKKYPDGRLYKVTVQAGEGTGTEQVTMSSDEITVVPGPRSNGLRGLSFLSYGRNSIGVGLAGERAAAANFANGGQIGGVLVPADDQDLSKDDIDAIKDDLDQHLYATAKSGKIPILNKVLKFSPWQMTNADAQFLESRAFQIEEIARWLGVPPHLLMQLDKQTSWGTGVLQQNKNLAQYVLKPWLTRLEQRLSRLIKDPARKCEFDFAGLEAGSAADEIDLILKQVNGGLITANEGRRIRNMPTITGGDELRIPSGVMLQDQLDAAAQKAAAEAATVGVPTETEQDPQTDPAAVPPPEGTE